MGDCEILNKALSNLKSEKKEYTEKTMTVLEGIRNSLETGTADICIDGYLHIAPALFKEETKSDIYATAIKQIDIAMESLRKLKDPQLEFEF